MVTDQRYSGVLGHALGPHALKQHDQVQLTSEALFVPDLLRARRLSRHSTGGLLLFGSQAAQEKGGTFEVALGSDLDAILPIGGHPLFAQLLVVVGEFGLDAGDLLRRQAQSDFRNLGGSLHGDRIDTGKDLLAPALDIGLGHIA